MTNPRPNLRPNRDIPDVAGDPPSVTEPCPDCDEAAKHAYSDATTPGFFSPKCKRHNAAQPEPREEVMPNATTIRVPDVTGEAHPTNTPQPDLGGLVEYAVCRRDSQDHPDCASYTGGKCDCGFMELIAEYNAARRLSPDQPSTPRDWHMYWKGYLTAKREAERHPDRKLVEGLLAIRDALVRNDPEEAYHQLYQLADRGRNSLTPWDEWEAALKTQEPAPKEKS